MRSLDADTAPERLADALLDALREGVAIVGLGPVYTLVASPTAAGAKALRRAKARRPGKTWSTGLADVRRLTDLVPPGALDDGLREALPMLRGAILRLPVGAGVPDTPAVVQATHQVLPLPDALRPAFSIVEAATAVDPAIFAGRDYRAVLMTSCNVSGDTAGGIVDEREARAFGLDRGIPLLVRSPDDGSARGSLAIVSLRGRSWTLERPGVGLDAFRASLPTGVVRT